MRALIILIMSVIWGLVSWQWYVCGIKGFCKTEEVISKTVVHSAPVILDTDGDGINDDIEIALSIDPNNPDTDEDGLLDGVEIGNDTSRPIDSDNDGIIDALDRDDDNDGKLTITESADPNGDKHPEDAEDIDGDEIANYLDSNDQDGPYGDLDNDTLTNEIEGIIGTDPNNPDTDGDSINDNIEVGSNHQSPLDLDNNGVIDALEIYIEVEEPKEEIPDQTVKIVVEQPDFALIYFPFNNHTSMITSKDTGAYFDNLIKRLNDGKTAHLVGHTDNIGNQDKNQELGLKRAQMVKQILIERGAPESQLYTDSRGELMPIESNETIEGRNKNRRVEITIK